MMSFALCSLAAEPSSSPSLERRLAHVGFVRVLRGRRLPVQPEGLSHGRRLQPGDQQRLGHLPTETGGQGRLGFPPKLFCSAFLKFLFILCYPGKDCCMLLQ